MLTLKFPKLPLTEKELSLFQKLRLCNKTFHFHCNKTFRFHWKILYFDRLRRFLTHCFICCFLKLDNIMNFNQTRYELTFTMLKLEVSLKQ